MGRLGEDDDMSVWFHRSRAILDQLNKYDIFYVLQPVVIEIHRWIITVNRNTKIVVINGYYQSVNNYRLHLRSMESHGLAPVLVQCDLMKTTKQIYDTHGSSHVFVLVYARILRLFLGCMYCTFHKSECCGHVKCVLG
jgi:hypothetical protein